MVLEAEVRSTLISNPPLAMGANRACKPLWEGRANVPRLDGGREGGRTSFVVGRRRGAGVLLSEACWENMVQPWTQCWCKTHREREREGGILMSVTLMEM